MGLASVAKAKTLEAIREGEAKEAEAVAKNQLAEDALNQLKETSSVETARLTAANEAAKTEAAELNEAIGNINDQLDDANTMKTMRFPQPQTMQFPQPQRVWPLLWITKTVKFLPVPKADGKGGTSDKGKDGKQG